MPIITECPDCNRPLFVGVTGGRFRPVECEDCGHRMVVELTTLGGTTYPEEEFVDDVLPALDDVERIDHPDADVYVYGDPAETKPRPIEDVEGHDA